MSPETTISRVGHADTITVCSRLPTFVKFRRIALIEKICEQHNQTSSMACLLSNCLD